MDGDQTVSKLLEDVELGRVVLPEIQREFVWSKQKARDLIDSLYKKFPVGVILLWRPRDIQDFRPLMGQDKAKSPDRLILDGQQRITSLELTKKGKIKVRFNIDDESFQIENKAIENNPKWIRVDEIWSKGTAIIIQELQPTLNMSMDDIYKKHMEKIDRIAKILDRFIPVFDIREDDYSRIAEMYMRLNEKGTKLKKAEINLALIVLKIPNKFYGKLREIVDEFEEWELDVNFFLRCFVCISTNQSKFEPLRKHLEATNEDKVLKDLDVISENLQESLQFIASHFGINQDNSQQLIPSNIALIPLIMYMTNNNARIASEEQTNKIILWFYCASHYGRFSKSTESTLNEDLRELKGPDPVGKWLERIRKERGDLRMREIRGRINKTNLFALYYALRSNEAVDWWKGTKIDDTAKIELHHIFPKKVLRDAGIPDNLINDIRNIAIVSKKANRKISAMPPEKYFKKEIEDMDRVFRQFVPEDPKYWEVENYQGFLETREKNILSALNTRISELEKSLNEKSL